VLLEETLGWLLSGPGLYLDATLGDGGHAEALLDREPRARLLGCDRDLDALAVAGERLARFGARVSLAHASFAELPAAHGARGGEPLTGALFDLGVSSRQIDAPERGLSFMREGPLDMRMDRSRGATLAERLAASDEAEVAHALREHGDVGPAARIARAILDASRSGSLTTTQALARVVEGALGRRPHPRVMAQVYQALRIWTNQEFEQLDAALGWLPSVVAPGGVVVTLAYHSGEDRRIKRALRGNPPPASRRLPPPAFPTPPGPPEGPWDELTRRVVTPGADEVARNPRARSARLRAFRRKAT
jgi:16S rRNA (cytosine1402-N4)-methyltransferase